MRKRINNDFDALVEVSHEGVKIDLSLYEITSVRIVSNQAYKVTDYEVRNGSLFLHVTPLITPKLGRYKIVVTYRIADPALTDGFWNFEFDKYLVTIVGSSEEEDAGEVVITADAVIGMQGKSAYQVWLDEGNTGTVEDYLADIKGDPFTYDDLTPEQIALLQKPASDIATTVSNAEGLRVTAETNRNNAEGLRLSAEIIRNDNETDRIEAEGLRAGAETGRQTAEGLRVTAETNRNNAEGLRLSAEIIRNDNEADRIEAEGLRAGAEISRQTAEGLRVQAELNRQTNTSTAISNAEQATDDANDAALLANEKAGLANEKAELAATATTQANAARDGANSAAQTANEAATNISPAVINNEQVQAETYNVLNARISALESLIANGVFTYLQADTLIGVNSMLYKGAEFFLYGTAAPNFAPDFIGQFYINTTGAGTTYQAKGIANASDWKQTSN